MSNITLPEFASQATRVGIGIMNAWTQRTVYVYWNIDGAPERTDFAHDPLDGHILFTAQRVQDAILAVAPDCNILASSSLDFPDE